MRRNDNLILIGPKTILVPYRKEHVLTYHEWMKSPFLQEMTASEPLTLDEEYAMQQSWHDDEKKCTFILLAMPEPYTSAKDVPVDAIKRNAIMIGDVNIFLNDCYDNTFGEIEIMIAEEAFRRTGRGLEALKMMMAYALSDLGLYSFHAKISLANKPSIDLFTNKLAFYKETVSEAFQEMTLEWSLRSPPSTSQDDEPSYGSKASPEQRESINAMHQELLAFWNSSVLRAEYA